MFQKQRLPLTVLFLGLLLFMLAGGSAVRASGGPLPPTPPVVTPTPVLSHTPTRVAGLHMIDNTTGWILSADGSVLRTNDAGLTWADVTPPALLALKQPVAEGSQFVDASNAWVIALSNNASFSFHTSNAGQTWQEGTLSANESAKSNYTLDAISSQEAWAIAAQTKGNIRLYHTTDSGQTWTQANAPIALQYTTLPSISFANQQTGIITGTATTTNNGVIYLTQDGGASWQNITVQSPDPAWKLDATLSPQFLTASDGFFTASYHTLATEGIAGNPLQGFSIFRTHDGGQTWTSTPIVNLGMIGGGAPTKFFDSQQGYTLVYIGQAGQQALYTTRDGGQHWTSTAVNIPNQTLIPTNLVGGVPDFTSLTTGWALLASQQGTQPVTPTSLYTTVDGGQTWTQVHAHFPSFITPPSAY